MAIPPDVWEAIIDEVMCSRNSDEELFCCVFGNTHSLGEGRVRFFYRDHYVPNAEQYEQQSRTYLSLAQDRHVGLINTYIAHGMSVLHIHTHPGHSTPVFSRTDDIHERRYAMFLRSFRPRVHFLSAVFDQDMGNSSWRSWDIANGIAQFNVKFRHGGDAGGGAVDWDVLSRQQIFGYDFARRLGHTAVTLVGCGGIGSVFVEQMSRLGVRNWVLVDPDRLDISNLNRMPFASREDVGRFKTSMARTMIRRIWGNKGVIKQIRGDIRGADARREAAKSDFLVVASDNHYSRAISQEISSRFVRTLVSLASQIYKDGGAGPRFYARVVCPPTSPNKWSLISCGAVSLHQAAQELAPSSIKADLVSQGYIDEVEAPAVYWLNSICASLGVKIIQEKVLGSLHEDGVDWLVDCGRNVWHKLSHKDDTNCLYTSNRDDGFFGRGFHT